jgi:hypothetical protein
MTERLSAPGAIAAETCLPEWCSEMGDDGLAIDVTAGWQWWRRSPILSISAGTATHVLLATLSWSGPRSRGGGTGSLRANMATS